MGSVSPSPVLCQCPGHAPLPPQQVLRCPSSSLEPATVSVCQSGLHPRLSGHCGSAAVGGLIEGEDFQFRDMRVASTLLKLHTVLCSAPYSAVATNAAPEVSIRVKPCSEDCKFLIVYCIENGIVIENFSTVWLNFYREFLCSIGSCVLLRNL